LFVRFGVPSRRGFLVPAAHRSQAEHQRWSAILDPRRNDPCNLARKETAMSTQLVVHNPMGYPPKVSGKALAPRLDTLDGRTVYLVDCRFDDSDILLKSVQAWFAEHMPAVKTVYKPISNVYTRDDPATWEEIKANGDAAIIGVGH
jgi:hypothetical protein